MKKEVVKLRTKKLKDGGESLYLDCYRDGKRTFEFLKMYIQPGTDAITKELNRNTMQAARLIQARRIVEIESGEANMLVRSDRTLTILDLFDKKMSEYDEGASTWNNLRKYRAIIERSGKMNGSADQLTTSNIKDFLSWMAKDGYADNTIYMVFSMLGSVLKMAADRKLIKSNPVPFLKSSERPKYRETKREYLTMDEVRRMAETPCRHDMVKRAFMFSCFTGLRYSDDVELCWGDISDDMIIKEQHKTKNQVSIPINDNAKMWMPKKGKAKKSDKVFKEFAEMSKVTMTKAVKAWAKKAGIDKHVTFHTSRHTCATLLLTYGADLYTVSKILGHTNISTTQIYAKVVDEKKVSAIDSIPKL